MASSTTLSEPIRVAIASENDEYDAEIYRALLRLVLGRPVIRWNPGDKRFSGWKSIATQADLFLRAAEADGVAYALFAVDNDGGARRRLDHQPDHVVLEHAADEDAGCRYCWLLSAVPPWWRTPGRFQCLTIPVQTLETWLLHVGGYAFSSPTPEQTYDRAAIKKLLFGKPLPPLVDRTARALARLDQPGALERLRELSSFRRFEAELAGW